MKIETIIKKIRQKLRGGVVTLSPESASRGRVLLSYKTEPFFDFETKLHRHTNIWECREIARIFLRLGYTVDVIDWFNHTFKPTATYKYFLDLGPNLTRIGSVVGKDCEKIFHATTSHWLFNNIAEYQRLLELQKRRGVVLVPRRTLIPNSAIEEADTATILGNETTENTYAFAKKKMHQIPLSTTHVYPFPEDRDIEKAKKNFVWLGGVGAVHKGLDLVLDAFVKLPNCNLFVCGDIQSEKDFEKLYWNELYNTSNIKMFGRVDVGGDIFRSIASNSVALIYPSCSEGQSGSVITCMHAGLIPVVSYQSGVDVNDFGLIMKENTIEEIRQMIRSIVTMSNSELKRRSGEAWKYARENHTRERFSEEFTKFVKMLEG